MRVLVTGGAGYIGATVASACADAGHHVVLLDDFSTGRREYVREFSCYEGSIGNRELLDKLFDAERIEAVVHCAASIVVPESVEDPLGYYANNVSGSITLLQAMVAARVNRLVFSSSASVYGRTDALVVSEDASLRPDSPYASSKAMMEQIMADTANAGLVRCIALRYFNPVGADPQLRTGQQLEQPSHVVGMMTRALLTGDTFTVTGTDWPTRDGSGLRDFIHVWDLALAHVAALERFGDVTAEDAFVPINIGTGRGTTVRELLVAFEEAAGRPVTTVDGPPRPGDVAGACASAELAHELLGWSAEKPLVQALKDHLRWVQRRPAVLGY